MNLHPKRDYVMCFPPIVFLIEFQIWLLLFMTSFSLFHYVHYFFVIVHIIFFLQRFKFQIIYVQINAFLLILLSTLHFCELICRFFGCSIMINKKTIYPIVEMDDLDFIIGDIAFVENSQLHQHFIL
jgi:hypothetical protein